MSTLVTGGAGFIGSLLVEKLVDKGYSTLIIDKMMFDGKGIEHIKNRIKLVQKDIRDITEEDLKGVDCVMHLAGMSNDPTADYNPESNMEINFHATIKLAELCKKLKIKKFIFASSASIYDQGAKGADTMLDENSQSNPKAAYSVSKFEAEEGLTKMWEEGVFEPIIFRKGTVYGFSKRMRYDLVVNTMTRHALDSGKITAFCGGTQWRPMVDVSDVCDAYIAVLEQYETASKKGQIYNLVGDNYCMLNLAHEIKDVLENDFGHDIKVNVDYDFRIDRSYRVSGDKITKELGFKPKVTVRDSVKTIVKGIEKYKMDDWNNKIYYNIQWMILLHEMEERLKKMGSVF